MVSVYSQLDGFPKESEQPDYFRALANVGAFTHKPDTALLVGVSEENELTSVVLPMPLRPSSASDSPSASVSEISDSTIASP